MAMDPPAVADSSDEDQVGPVAGEGSIATASYRSGVSDHDDTCQDSGGSCSQAGHHSNRLAWRGVTT
jgi:hypothetical protein